MNCTLSIACPLYQSADIFKTTFRTILDQVDQLDCTYEIILSNDASLDGTNELCLNLIKKYSQYNINYINHASNLGLYNNYNYLANIAQGEFIVFPSHDDHVLGEYYAEAIYELRKNPDIVLVHGHTRVINTSNNEVIRYETCYLMGTGCDSLTRFLNTVKCYETAAIQGVFRRSKLMQTNLFNNIPGSDHLLLNQLSLYGEFKSINKIVIDYYEDESKFLLKEDILKILNRQVFFKTNWLIFNIKTLIQFRYLSIYEKLSGVLRVFLLQKRFLTSDIKILIDYILKIFVNIRSIWRRK